MQSQRGTKLGASPLPHHNHHHHPFFHHHHASSPFSNSSVPSMAGSSHLCRYVGCRIEGAEVHVLLGGRATFPPLMAPYPHALPFTPQHATHYVLERCGRGQLTGPSLFYCILYLVQPLTPSHRNPPPSLPSSTAPHSAPLRPSTTPPPPPPPLAPTPDVSEAGASA